MKNNPIGLFDSGIGGISVLDECRKLLPCEDFVYLADTPYGPYGNKSDDYITERVFECSRRLFSLGCKALVIACNTATNVGAAALRDKYQNPIIGLEPALKPAFEAYNGGSVLVLCTPATAKQQKFRKLLEIWEGKNIIVAPQNCLAWLIEKNIENLEAVWPHTKKILSAYDNVTGVVLGCTHYVFIKEQINRFYRSHVKIFDGNEGAAKRLKYLLKKEDLLCNKTSRGGVQFIS